MQTPRDKPLASQLIRKVLPIYLAFAIAVTLMQISLAYRDTRTAVLHELDSTARAFEPAVADALWSYQLYLLPQLAEVITSAGAVLGVDIGDAHKLYVTHASGIDGFGEFSKRVDLFHANGDGTRTPIGYITLYSGHGVVIERVKVGALLIVAASIIMTLGLWMIVVFFVNRVLARPLRRFTAQIASIDPGQATEAPRLSLGAAPSAELVYLRDTFTDLAERALQSRKLAVQKEAAEAANLAKSRFLAAASHDLRQPMHALNLYLGMLARVDLATSARELLLKARACGATMDEMFRTLLDISRLDAAAIQPEIGVFPLAPLLERLRLQFEPEARAKDLDLRIASCSAFVRSDAGMIERIARNLVANAVRYTERGSILIGCRRRGAAVRFAVYDTGPGIPAHEQRAIFDEFYQLRVSQSGSARGMGLGLAIVERLARLLSLPVMLVSEVGRGSMFAVDIPRAAFDETHGISALALAKTPPRPGSALLVVIDDDPTILDATRTVLENWGYAVITATSATDALARLRTSARAPDALICDYNLRAVESGVDAIRGIRTELNRDIPALLITGDTAPERLRELHDNDLPVLHKPIDEHALREALLRLLRDRTTN